MQHGIRSEEEDLKYASIKRRQRERENERDDNDAFPSELTKLDEGDAKS
jgi:hypothetical protein